MLPRSVTSLGVSVLALLFERPMHPYEMWQVLRDRSKDRIVKVRPGSLYHAVERLERDELVAVTGVDRQGNRPERTVYEITASGRDAVRQWVADTVRVPALEYPRFTLGLSELHNLPSGEALTLLDERIAALAAQLADFEELAALSRDVPELFTVPFAYTRAMVRAESDWLRTFVERVRAGDVPWVTDPHLASLEFTDLKGTR
ncbi:PadR family transcriptional regulator [Prescottella subtropica]|uniref:PadR family transcriptional regulator n=1 Tax=Prescottella subtropica TaxID=2545757 RepID=UPI0010F6E439|nr:PadR family transcriptional regulator [Prescottella subtropica]